MRVNTFILILLWPSYLWAEYTSAEILVIPWGDGPDELKILEPYKEEFYVSEDSVIEDWNPSGGPHWIFVDVDEKIYFGSYDIGYLKAFDNNGNVFIDYQFGVTEHDSRILKSTLTKFCVDSHGLIYISGHPSYVSISDAEGNFLGYLTPPGGDSLNESNVDLTFYNFNDEITVNDWSHSYIYKDGEFYENGYSSWKASDNYYYHAMKYDESSFMFMKFHTYEQIDTFYVSFDGNLHLGSLMGIDLNDQFFMIYTEEPVDMPSGVLILNNSFNEIERFEIFPRPENEYLWYVHNSPFLRGDGNVYQFLCEDDGMHVIRWSKE